MMTEVITCKECKFAHMTSGEIPSCKYCDMFCEEDGTFTEVYFPSSFYCAYAKKKDEKKEDKI